jgi:hypothetical protein
VVSHRVDEGIGERVRFLRSRAHPTPGRRLAIIQLSMNPAEALRRTRSTLLASDALKDFFAVNGNVFRCVDADAYLFSFDRKHRDGDVSADHHGFLQFSRHD